MSDGTPDGRQPGTSDVREAAREKAVQIRELRKKKDRRRRTILQASIIGGTIAIVAVVAIVLVSLSHPEGRGPLNMASDGIKIGANLDAVRTGGLAPEATPSATKLASPSRADRQPGEDHGQGKEGKSPKGAEAPEAGQGSKAAQAGRTPGELPQ